MILDRPTLYTHYWVQNMSITQIATLYDTSPSAIYDRLKRWRIPRRSVGTKFDLGHELMMLWPSVWEWERWKNEKLVREIAK